MYSRFSSKPPENIKIPEHYSGCAFSTPKKEPTPKKPASQLDIAKPSPLPPLSPPAPIAEPTEVPHREPPREEKKPEPPPAAKEASLSPLTSLFGGIGKSFPFGHGIGFEELLILGLILLLSQTESDSHLVLMLGLLLFCG